MRLDFDENLHRIAAKFAGNSLFAFTNSNRFPRIASPAVTKFIVEWDYES